MKAKWSLAVIFAVLLGIAACGQQAGQQQQAPAGGGTEAPATSTTTAPGVSQGTTGQAGM